MIVSRGGGLGALGAYPTDPYFDKSRPAWLPFWIDTPDENAQKWGLYPGADLQAAYPAPPMPATVKPPAGALTDPAVQNPASGAAANATVDGIIAAQHAAQAAQTQAFMDALAAAVDPAKTPAAISTVTWVVIGAAMLLALKFASGK